MGIVEHIQHIPAQFESASQNPCISEITPAVPFSDQKVSDCSPVRRAYHRVAELVQTGRVRQTDSKLRYDRPKDHIAASTAG